MRTTQSRKPKENRITNTQCGFFLFSFPELEYSLLNASLKEKKSFLKMAGGGGLIMYKELECPIFQVQYYGKICGPIKNITVEKK